MKITILTVMVIVATSLLNSKGYASEKKSNHKAENTEESLDYYHKEDPNTSRGSRPMPPKIISPTPVTAVAGPDVTLEWQKVDNADSYHLQVSENPGFFNPIVNEPLYTDIKFTIKGLEKGRLYFWRVAAFKKDNVPGESKSNFSLGSFKIK